MRTLDRRLACRAVVAVMAHSDVRIERGAHQTALLATMVEALSSPEVGI
jgi:hypothetical protein